MDTAEDNSKCFVISPIGSSGSVGYRRAKNVLDYVITPAAAAVGLEAVRADDLAQPGSITTQVIQQLISAKMVVADLSELNPNVFYELAVRDSFGLPVVLIAEEDTELPFDLIQQRTIFFDSSDLSSAIPARAQIERALREALADPSAGSPVKAAVDLNTLRSGNPEERQVADLAEQVARLGQEVGRLQRVSTLGGTPSSLDDQTTTAPPSLLRSQLVRLSTKELRKLIETADELSGVHDAANSSVLTAIREELSARGVDGDQ